MRVFLLILLAVSTIPLAANARDLALTDVERLVVERNRDVIFARRSAELAQAQIVSAGARPNPVVSVNSSNYSPATGIGSGTPYDKTLDTVLRIDQTVERGNKRALRVSVAESMERAARTDITDSVRVQRLAASLAYYDLLAAQKRQQLLIEQASLFAATADAAHKRADAGDMAAADAARVAVDLDRARNDVRNGEADVRRAQIALSVLISDEQAAATLVAADPWPDSSDIDVGELDVIIEARPDVAAARIRIEAADRARDLARSLRTRDVTIGAQVERFPGTVPATTLGVGVSFPLFAFYAYDGEIKASETARYAAMDALDRTRANARAEIGRALNDLTSARERVARYADSLLPGAVRIANAAEFAFARGATSVTDVLDARRTLRAVQLEALAARADFARAMVALRIAQEQ